MNHYSTVFSKLFHIFKFFYFFTAFFLNVDRIYSLDWRWIKTNRSGNELDSKFLHVKNAQSSGEGQESHVLFSFSNQLQRNQNLDSIHIIEFSAISAPRNLLRERLNVKSLAHRRQNFEKNCIFKP